MKATCPNHTVWQIGLIRSLANLARLGSGAHHTASATVTLLRLVQQTRHIMVIQSQTHRAITDPPLTAINLLMTATGRAVDCD